MFNTIAISLSPNTEKKDYITAFKLLFSPKEYIKGRFVKKLEDWFKNYFKVRYAVSFNSGRSAEFAILKAFSIGANDEVLIQAFTCVAVPNAIILAGAKPVYVDIEKETLNMNPRDLKRKITKKSLAIIVQHTFGIVGDVREIREITKKHKLFLIEDCAHSLGVPINSDAAFFSFGRDKVVSSVFGGMAITNNKKIGEKLVGFQKQLSFPSKFWIAQQLLHPIFFSIILPTYNFFNLGKVILVVAQKLKLLSFPNPPNFYPARMPNALSKLTLTQLTRLENFNKKRREIVRVYTREFGGKNFVGNILLRYPLLVDNPKRLLKRARAQGILLGDWYSNIVDPKDVSLSKVGYKKGSCPVAEKIAKKIINLPTYPRMTRGDVEKVIEVVKKYS